ncbi:hypothetical protein BJF84_15600 [Rhodococcus sp. CUA-806]|nr:hypothetical protein BJF84_26815 [Rhodococcus sp. CUA-806]OLT34983.1 hypothetical protein BJF84_15600 [Rhodococcus sp. CUA-806]
MTQPVIKSNETDLTALSAADLMRGYLSRNFSPREVVDAHLSRIDDTGDKFNAFISICPDIARAEAREAEKRLMSSSEALPIGFGVPITVKDITPTEGIRTTRGSAKHAHWIPEFDATAVSRLRKAGSVILGKTNTSEGAWKAEGSNPTFGSSLNPFAPGLTSGGSSGGAGVATAMRYGTWALGTDGFGSIRVPASFCNVVGFKPTLAAVPYFPVSAEFMSHIGPLTRTVADARDAFLAMAGPDIRDPLATTDMTRLRDERRRSLTIGVLEEVDGDPPDPEVASAADEFVAWLTSEGHRAVSVQVPTGGAEIVATISMAFAALELDDDTEAELERRDQDLVSLRTAASGLSAVDLAAAQSLRVDYRQRILRIFESVDYVVSPTVSRLPFDVGGHSPSPYSDDVTHWNRWCSRTYPWNLAGNPAISVPWSNSKDGLPIGMQIIGAVGNDFGVLDMAAEVELYRPWRDKYAFL